MSEKTFEVIIKQRYCKGCGLCVEFCPQGKLFIRRKPNKLGVQTAAVDPAVDCTGCRQCVIICPDAAIELRRFETAGAGATEQEGAAPGRQADHPPEKT